MNKVVLINRVVDELDDAILNSEVMVDYYDDGDYTIDELLKSVEKSISRINFWMNEIKEGNIVLI